MAEDFFDTDRCRKLIKPLVPRVQKRNWIRFPLMDMFLWQVFGISDFFVNMILMCISAYYICRVYTLSICILPITIILCQLQNCIVLWKANKRSIDPSIYIEVQQYLLGICGLKTRIFEGTMMLLNLMTILVHLPPGLFASALDFGVLRRWRQQNVENSNVESSNASKLESFRHLLKQVIPEQATLVLLGRWSSEENKILCNVELSVSGRKNQVQFLNFIFVLFLS